MESLPSSSSRAPRYDARYGAFTPQQIDEEITKIALTSLGQNSPEEAWRLRLATSPSESPAIRYPIVVNELSRSIGRWRDLLFLRTAGDEDFDALRLELYKQLPPTPTAPPTGAEGIKQHILMQQLTKESYEKINTILDLLSNYDAEIEKVWTSKGFSAQTFDVRAIRKSFIGANLPSWKQELSLPDKALSPKCQEVFATAMSQLPNRVDNLHELCQDRAALLEEYHVLVTSCKPQDARSWWLLALGPTIARFLQPLQGSKWERQVLDSPGKASSTVATARNVLHNAKKLLEPLDVYKQSMAKDSEDLKVNSDTTPHIIDNLWPAIARALLQRVDLTDSEREFAIQIDLNTPRILITINAYRELFIRSAVRAVMEALEKSSPPPASSTLAWDLLYPQIVNELGRGLALMLPAFLDRPLDSQIGPSFVAAAAKDLMRRKNTKDSFLQRPGDLSALGELFARIFQQEYLDYYGQRYQLLTDRQQLQQTKDAISGAFGQEDLQPLLEATGLNSVPLPELDAENAPELSEEAMAQARDALNEADSLIGNTQALLQAFRKYLNDVTTTFSKRKLPLDRKAIIDRIRPAVPEILGWLSQQISPEEQSILSYSLPLLQLDSADQFENYLTENFDVFRNEVDFLKERICLLKADYAAELRAQAEDLEVPDIDDAVVDQLNFCEKHYLSGLRFDLDQVWNMTADDFEKQRTTIPERLDDVTKYLFGDENLTLVRATFGKRKQAAALLDDPEAVLRGKFSILDEETARVLDPILHEELQKQKSINLENLEDLKKTVCQRFNKRQLPILRQRIGEVNPNPTFIDRIIKDWEFIGNDIRDNSKLLDNETINKIIEKLRINADVVAELNKLKTKARSPEYQSVRVFLAQNLEWQKKLRTLTSKQREKFQDELNELFNGLLLEKTQKTPTVLHAEAGELKTLKTLGYNVKALQEAEEQGRLQVKADKWIDWMKNIDPAVDINEILTRLSPDQFKRRIKRYSKHLCLQACGVRPEEEDVCIQILDLMNEFQNTLRRWQSYTARRLTITGPQLQPFLDLLQNSKHREAAKLSDCITQEIFQEFTPRFRAVLQNPKEAQQELVAMRNDLCGKLRREKLLERYKSPDLEKNIDDELKWFAANADHCVCQFTQGWDDEQEVLGGGVCLALSVRFLRDKVFQQQIQQGSSSQAFDDTSRIEAKDRFFQAMYKSQGKLGGDDLEYNKAFLDGNGLTEITIQPEPPNAIEIEGLQDILASPDVARALEKSEYGCILVLGGEESGHAIAVQIDLKKNLYRFFDPNYGVFEYGSQDELAKNLDSLVNTFYSYRWFRIEQPIPKSPTPPTPTPPPSPPLPTAPPA